MTTLPDAAGRARPSYAPPCCKAGLWVLHPVRGTWCCSECGWYGPLRRTGYRDRAGWRVTLSDAQVERAVQAGVGRDVRARRRGARSGHYSDGDERQLDAERSADQHVLSAGAELGLHLLTGQPWDDSARPGKRPDVGAWHVRATRHADGHLILYAPGPAGHRVRLRKSDGQDPPGLYVLAVGDGRDYRYAGWSERDEALAGSTWAPQGRPGWWCPQAALHTMATLPEAT